MSRPASVEDVQKFMLIHFRKALRGQKIRSNIERWLSGEFGTDHEFPAMLFPANLGDDLLAFIRDPQKRQELDAEWIEDPR